MRCPSAERSHATAEAGRPPSSASYREVVVTAGTSAGGGVCSGQAKPNAAGSNSMMRTTKEHFAIDETLMRKLRKTKGEREEKNIENGEGDDS